MGVLNVTPDSFFDGGRYVEAEAARQRSRSAARRRRRRSSTSAPSRRDPARRRSPPRRRSIGWTPRSSTRSRAARWFRSTRRAPRSPITRSRLGARIVNDVSCLADAELAATAARHGATLVLMHARGAIGAMQGLLGLPGRAATATSSATCARNGARPAIARSRAASPPSDVWLDPGHRFRQERAPVVRAPRPPRRAHERGRAGRRRAEPKVVHRRRGRRRGRTSASAERSRRALLAAERGARVLRVHDVQAVGQALGVRSPARAPPPRGRHA